MGLPFFGVSYAFCGTMSCPRLVRKITVATQLLILQLYHSFFRGIVSLRRLYKVYLPGNHVLASVKDPYQGRSQDFSGGVSQELLQQRRRRGVCDARAHTSSTLMLASFPGLLPPLCAMHKPNLSIARAGGGEEVLELSYAKALN